MDSPTAISVIVPCYKVKGYVAECVRSLFRQTLQEAFEIILVDDCDPDHSVEEVRAIETEKPAHISLCYLRHERNRGLSAARNTGTDAARGEYMLYVDSDDAVSPECLSRLLEAARESGADMTVGMTRILPEGGEREFRDFTEGCLDNERALTTYLQYKVDGTAWNKLVRRAFIAEKRVRFREGFLHEDELWNVDMFLAGATLCGTPYVTYMYRSSRTGSIMGGKVFDHLRTCTEVCNVNAESFQRSRFKDLPEVRLRLCGYSMWYLGSALEYTAGTNGWERWRRCRQMARAMAVATPLLCDHLRQAESRRIRMFGRLLSLPSVCFRKTLVALFIRYTCRSAHPTA